MTKRKRTKVSKGKNDLQNNTHKNKDRVTRTALKTGGKLGCCGKISSSCSTNGTRRDIISKCNRKIVETSKYNS